MRSYSAPKLDFRMGTMKYAHTTQVPNILFDHYLRTLTLAELKLLLVIIRQTNGWIDKRTGQRKVRDRISYSQFISKTKLSRRIISRTIQVLVRKQLILITDSHGASLKQPRKRKGRQYLYYQCTFESMLVPSTSALREPRLVQKSVHNKTKNIKTKRSDNASLLKSIIADIKKSMQI